MDRRMRTNIALKKKNGHSSTVLRSLVSELGGRSDGESELSTLTG